MNFNDYTIELKFFSETISSSNQSLKISLRDSIHSFFPTSMIEVQDSTGILREGFFNSNGTEFSVGIANSLGGVESKFIVNSSDSTDGYSQGLFNGKIILNCLHEYYNKQSVENKPYKNTVSGIVKSIVEEYKFSKLNISNTDSELVWYRIAQSQKEFIEKVLLPNSYGSNSNETPYYSFIDNNNGFNFTSWEEMFSQSPVATFYYKPSRPEDYSENYILSIKPFTKKYSDYEKSINSKVYYRDYNSGEYSVQDSFIQDFPKNKNKENLLPFINTTAIKSVLDENILYDDYARKETNKARLIHKNKSCMGLEYFIVTVPFNHKLLSGKTLELETYVLTGTDVAEKSFYNSGKFLIEECVHSWDGENKTAYTTMIVSRKFVKVPNKYINKSKLRAV